MTLLLEDFALPVRMQPSPEIDRTEVFDQGYREGWNDAASAIKADDLRLGESLAEHLLGMAHTQAAAASLCLAQIEPLLTELFDKILPRAADRAFLSLILQEAETLLAAKSDKALIIRVAPEALGPLHDILGTSGEALVSVQVEAEPGMDPLQARLVHPDGEREIDLTRILDAMDEAFEALHVGNRIPNS